MVKTEAVHVPNDPIDDAPSKTAVYLEYADSAFAYTTPATTYRYLLLYLVKRIQNDALDVLFECLGAC